MTRREWVEARDGRTPPKLSIVGSRGVLTIDIQTASDPEFFRASIARIRGRGETYQHRSAWSRKQMTVGRVRYIDIRDYCSYEEALEILDDTTKDRTR